jgi:hypothetical protein
MSSAGGMGSETRWNAESVMREVSASRMTDFRTPDAAYSALLGFGWIGRGVPGLGTLVGFSGASPVA